MPYNLSAGRCCSLIFCSLLQSPLLVLLNRLVQHPPEAMGCHPHTNTHTYIHTPACPHIQTHTHTHTPNLYMYTYIDKLRRLPFRFFLLCFTCLVVLCLMDLCFDVQTVYTILGNTTAQPYMRVSQCCAVCVCVLKCLH